MNATLRACAVVSLLGGLAWQCDFAAGQSPTIASFSPLGLRPGNQQDLVVRGANLAMASELWTSFGARGTLSPHKANNGKNAGEATFRLDIPVNTPPGIYGARVATDKGISTLHLLLVDDLPSVARQPGNSTPATAQSVSLPSAIDGTVESLARHYYTFHAEAGQRLTFEVFARRIGSALDPTLRLFDAKGRELAYSDDVPGLSEDAAIAQTFTSAGDYRIEVSDNQYRGGGDYHYRLRIGDFPAAVLPIPLAAKRGREVTVHFADLSEGSVEPASVKAPADPLLRAIQVPARFATGATRAFTTLILSDHNQFLESEPNDDRKAANRVEPNTDLNGRLEGANDIDRFVFTGKAGQQLRLTSVTRRLGSPADVVLRLTKADGSQVGYGEGNGPTEAALTANFSADGDYILEVRDLNHLGGPRAVYHVDATTEPTATVATLTLSLSADSIDVPAGGTAMVAVSAKRLGFTGPIAVEAVGLPAGVTSVPTVIGPGQEHAYLCLTGTPTAVNGKVDPIRLLGSARAGAAEVRSDASITGALELQLSGMPHPPIALSEATAIGIAPRPHFSLRTEPTKIVVDRKKSTAVKIIVEREKGYDEEISLAVALDPSPRPTPATPAKPLLPAGITAAVKPIAKGVASVEVTIAADDKARRGDYTVVLTGTLKKGKESHTQPIPGIGIQVK